MTYIPARPIVADDPLAYFAALTAPKTWIDRPSALRPMMAAPAVDACAGGAPVIGDRALDLMFGYYNAD